MKLLTKLFLLSVVLLAACGPSRDEIEAQHNIIKQELEATCKHKVGDVVYIKPDSTKAAIREIHYYTNMWPYSSHEKGVFFTVIAHGTESSIPQELVYEPIKTENND